MSPDDPRHGSYAGAVQHWLTPEPLCHPCWVASTRYRKARKLERLAGQSRSVPALGVVRRVEALLALGWSWTAVADAAGMSVNALRSVKYHGSQTVRATTFEAVDAAYSQLSMILPQGRYPDRQRRWAARQGYAPPLAWDDIDTDPAPMGVRARELVQRHDHHTWEDHDELRAQGYTRAQIAHRLGMTVDALEKALARRRKEDAA